MICATRGFLIQQARWPESSHTSLAFPPFYRRDARATSGRLPRTIFGKQSLHQPQVQLLPLPVRRVFRQELPIRNSEAAVHLLGTSPVSAQPPSADCADWRSITASTEFHISTFELFHCNVRVPGVEVRTCGTRASEKKGASPEEKGATSHMRNSSLRVPHVRPPRK